MNRLEFHIAYDCKNKCIFCSEYDQLKKFKGYFVPREIIEDRLSIFSRNKFNHITFTGGEPTLHPDFIEILRLAKRLGYATYVTTNGGRLYSKIFSRKTLPYLDEICFSLHGHNAKLHNFHTGNSSSFKQLQKALKNINESCEDVQGFVNIVLTRYNFDYLDKIIDFVSSYNKIRQILISNFAPEGNGLHNFRDLVVPLKQIKTKVNEITKLRQGKALVLKFFGLPLCVLGESEQLSNDVWWSPRTTIERQHKNKKVFLKSIRSYRPVRKRVKIAKCRRCLKAQVCGGVFARYYQEFGNVE